MEFEVSREDGAGHVRISGEVDLSVADDLATALRIAGSDGGDVVVDLSELSFMDSSGVEVLQDAARALRGGQRLVVDHPTGIVAKVLRMTESRFDRHAESVVIRWDHEQQSSSKPGESIEEEVSLLPSCR
jgi:anti-anti-sigma factor